MNDKKERVYSEEDLCEYTILQKIDELERQLQNIRSDSNRLYETKEEARTAHTILTDNISSVSLYFLLAIASIDCVYRVSIAFINFW